MTVAKTVLGYIQNRDHRVMRRVNRWKAPRWIRYWMRPESICGGLRRGRCGNRGRACLQGAEENQPSQAPLSPGTSLLVSRASARPVFFSLGSHDDGVLDCAGHQLFLSRSRRRNVLSGRQHRGLARSARNALSKRRACWSGARIRAGRHGHCRLRLLRPGIVRAGFRFRSLASGAPPKLFGRSRDLWNR
jgi:hypothetical protein